MGPAVPAPHRPAPMHAAARPVVVQGSSADPATPKPACRRRRLAAAMSSPARAPDRPWRGFPYARAPLTGRDATSAAPLSQPGVPTITTGGVQGPFAPETLAQVSASPTVRL